MLELATVLIGCNNSHLAEEEGIWKVIGDTTEGVLLAAAIKAEGTTESIENVLPKVHEIPFDSDRKRSAVVRRKPDGKLRALVNGAPGHLLERCSRLYTCDGIRPLTTRIAIRSARLTNRSFLRTMALTGLLTA